MGLLLGGTLYGLASYRSAMGTCESKLDELDKAVHLRQVIQKLNGSYPDRAHRGWLIQRQISEIDSALQKYSAQLQETIDRGRALDGGKDEKALRDVLENDLQHFSLILQQEVVNPTRT